MGHGHFEAVNCIQLVVCWLYQVAYTYLGDRPYKLNSPAATCCHFPNSGKKNFENLKL